MKKKEKSRFIKLMDSQQDRIDQLRAVIQDESLSMPYRNKARRVWQLMIKWHESTMIDYVLYDLEHGELLPENPPERRSDTD